MGSNEDRNYMGRIGIYFVEAIQSRLAHMDVWSKGKDEPVKSPRFGG